jgi:alpha/beta superfamily hydrolase
VGLINSRAVSIESDGPKLEGLLHLPDQIPAPGVIVCHPHPMYGGDMHNNVVDAICETAFAEGIAALRFNFRGTGASEGDYDGGIGEQGDVRAAVAYLRGLPELDAVRIALAGYSFGAAVALQAVDNDMSALIAVSLPTSMPLKDLRLFGPALFVSGDEDQYSDPGELTRLVRDLGPTAELKLLPGLGHFWFGVERDLQAILAPFLRAHVSAVASA